MKYVANTLIVLLCIVSVDQVLSTTRSNDDYTITSETSDASGGTRSILGYKMIPTAGGQPVIGESTDGEYSLDVGHTFSSDLIPPTGITIISASEGSTGGTIDLEWNAPGNDRSMNNIESVFCEDNCQMVLDKMRSSNLEGLPVVNSRNQRKILGMIWRKDILDAYNKEIERRDIATTLASRITSNNIDQDVHFLDGYEIAEIPAPEKFIGKSIRALNIRNKYGVDIILIRTNTENDSKIKAIPSPDYIISSNDTLVVAGEIGKINLLKNI